MVKNEFLTNPLYKGNLVSKDFKTSAVILNLYPDHKYSELKAKKKRLEQLKNPNEEERLSLRQTRKAFKIHRDEQRILQQQSIEEIGTVQSLASILKIGKQLNNDKALDGLNLGLLYTHLPSKYKRLILSPYISIENNQVRFATRVVDSNEALRRDILLKKIQANLNAMIDPKVGKF